MRWGRGVALVTLLVTLVVAPGCGRFARSGTTRAEEGAKTVKVGSDADLATTTAPAGGAGAGAATGAPGSAGDASGGGGTGTATRPPSVAAPGAAPSTSVVTKLPATAKERKDASGFVLTLAAGEKSTYRVDEAIPFRMWFVNSTDKTLLYDPNQRVHFILYRGSGDDWEPVWDNVSCAGRSPRQPQNMPTLGPVEIEAGDGGEFSSSLVPRDCKIAAGEYRVSGYLDWCPGHEAKPDSCTEGRAQSLPTTPIDLRLTA